MGASWGHRWGWQDKALPPGRVRTGQGTLPTQPEGDLFPPPSQAPVGLQAPQSPEEGRGSTPVGANRRLHKSSGSRAAPGPTPGPWGAQSPQGSHVPESRGPSGVWSAPWSVAQGGHGRRKGGGGARGPGSRFPLCAPLPSSPRVSVSGVSLVAYLGLKDAHALLYVPCS